MYLYIMTGQPQPTVEIWIQCTPATSTAVPMLPYVTAHARSYSIIIFYYITYYTIVIPTTATTFFFFSGDLPLPLVCTHDKCIIKILSTRHYYRHCCCWVFPSKRRSLVHLVSTQHACFSFLFLFHDKRPPPPFLEPLSIAASVLTCQHRTATAHGLIDDDVFKPLSAIISFFIAHVFPSFYIFFYVNCVYFDFSRLLLSSLPVRRLCEGWQFFLWFVHARETIIRDYWCLLDKI